jgi:serine/threonine protein kinase
MYIHSACLCVGRRVSYALCDVSSGISINIYYRKHAFQDHGYIYMLLEYVIGGELFSYLRKRGRFPTETARFFAAQIVLALEYIHSGDMAYRDLKPENVLLDHEGNIRLTVNIT